MRTYVYIDGLNLFHGLLEKTELNWPNPTSLIGSKLKYFHKIKKVKYFTTILNEKICSNHNINRQKVHHLQIEKHCPEVEFILGQFRTNTVVAKVAEPGCQKKKFEYSRL